MKGRHCLWYQRDPPLCVAIVDLESQEISRIPLERVMYLPGKVHIINTLDLLKIPGYPSAFDHPFSRSPLSSPIRTSLQPFPSPLQSFKTRCPVCQTIQVVPHENRGLAVPCINDVCNFKLATANKERLSLRRASKTKRACIVGFEASKSCSRAQHCSTIEHEHDLKQVREWL